MSRLALNLVTAVCVLLSAGLAALWPRTARFSDELTFISPSGAGYNLGTLPHRLQLSVSRNQRQLQAHYDPIPGGWSSESHRWGTRQTFSMAPAPAPATSAESADSDGVLRLGSSSSTFSSMTVDWTPNPPA